MNQRLAKCPHLCLQKMAAKLPDIMLQIPIFVPRKDGSQVAEILPKMPQFVAKKTAAKRPDL